MPATLKLTIPHTVEIPLSGSNIADLFWELDSNDQALFFNRLGGCEGLVFQLQAVTDSPDLTDLGRHAMRRIGEYSAAMV